MRRYWPIRANAGIEALYRRRLTALIEQMQVGGDALDNRAQVFNNYRNNRGLMLLDKEQEDFMNVSAPLGSLDKLQAQAQEHMASVSGLFATVIWSKLLKAQL